MKISQKIELANEIAESILIHNNPQSVIYEYDEYGDKCGLLDEHLLEFNGIYAVVMDSIKYFTKQNNL